MKDIKKEVYHELEVVPYEKWTTPKVDENFLLKEPTHPIICETCSNYDDKICMALLVGYNRDKCLQIRLLCRVIELENKIEELEKKNER